MKQTRRALFSLASLLAAGAVLYVVVAQSGEFRSSLSTLRQASLGWLLVCLLLTITTYLVAAVTYQCLALKKLRYKRTLLVQLAASFTNRVLPAGSGGIALNIDYLHRNRHSGAEAAAVAAMNNTLGLIGNLLLLAVAAAAVRGKLSLNWHHRISRHWLLVAAALLVVGLAVLFALRKSSRLQKFFHGLQQTAQVYIKRPSKVLFALASSLLLSCLYSALLYVAALASDAHITAFQALVVMSVGTAAGTFIPTPGGVGSAEAGLTAALLAVGVAPGPALATAIIDRVFTFWLPLLGGAVAFKRAQRYL